MHYRNVAIIDTSRRDIELDKPTILGNKIMKKLVLPQVRERNLEVLNPLMKKGGLQDRDCRGVQKKRDRRGTKVKLRQGDW